MKGHCGKFYVSAERTLKLKESLPSPSTLILVTESHGYMLTVQLYKLNKRTKQNYIPVRLECQIRVIDFDYGCGK